MTAAHSKIGMKQRVFMKFILATVAVVTAFLETSAHAQSIDSEWQSSLYSGSSRLILFSIIKEKPEGSLGFAHELLRRNGLNAEAQSGVQLIQSRTSVSPVLEWDSNINGGTPGDSFFLGNFEFAVDESSRAVAGVLAGLSSSATAHYSLGSGHTLDFGLRASFRHSPKYDLSKTSGQAHACGSYFLDNWAWLETCGRLQYTENDLGSVTDRVAEISGIKIFSSDLGGHEARAGLDVQFREDYAKSLLRLNLTTVRSGVGALALGFNVGEEIKGSNTLLYGATAKLSRPILGERGSVALSWSRLGGSEFFGVAREDDLISLNLTRNISASFSGTIGFTRRVSSIELYDEESFSIGISYGGWTF